MQSFSSRLHAIAKGWFGALTMPLSSWQVWFLTINFYVATLIRGIGVYLALMYDPFH